MDINGSLWGIFEKTGNPNIYILHKNIANKGEKGHAGHKGHGVGDKAVGIR